MTEFVDSSLVSAYSILSYEQPIQEEKPKEKEKETKIKEAQEKSKKLPEEKVKELRDKEKKEYPKGAFFCVASQFVERIAFNGFRVCLVLYLINMHNKSDHQAKFVYHSFMSFAYFTPILGSLMADGCFGKYLVIIFVSMVYCAGQIMLTVAAIPDLPKKAALSVFYVGLFIVAFGAGGIKPCIYTFTADQFPPHMTRQRKMFSSLYYFSLSLAALLAEFITPVFRRMNCLGQTSCYILAFGFPGLLVVAELVIFIAGKKYYKVKVVDENMLIQVLKCTCYALHRSCCCRCPKSGSWLDLAADKYDKQLIEDVKSLFHILSLFIPAIMFWALFDQQGSSWVLQASRMDGHFGYVTVVPGQTLLLNPLFIILLIPLFSFVIYPFFWKRGWLKPPLRRMGWGCIFAVLSFVGAGVVHVFINKTLFVRPKPGLVRNVVVNMDDCTLAARNGTTTVYITGRNYSIGDYSISSCDFYTENCTSRSNRIACPIYHRNPDYGHVLVFWRKGIKPKFVDYNLTKITQGRSLFNVIFHPNIINSNRSVTIIVDNPYVEGDDYLITVNDSSKFIYPIFFGSPKYDIALQECIDENDCTEKHLLTHYVHNGAVYYLILDEDDEYQFIIVVQPHSVSMAWMIPQFFLLTIGEILFAHSGSEFSYGQAAPSMKSTLQSCWLLSVAFGNNVDMLVSGFDLITDAAIESFAYAGLMLVATFLFVWLAVNYIYVDRDQMEAEKLKAKKRRHRRRSKSPEKGRRSRRRRAEHQLQQSSKPISVSMRSNKETLNTILS